MKKMFFLLVALFLILNISAKEIKDIQVELHVLFDAGNGEKEMLFDDFIVPAADISNYEKGMALVLKGDTDSDLKKAISSQYGLEESKIVIKKRFTHEVHFYVDNDCDLFERSWKNGKIVLTKMEFRKNRKTTSKGNPYGHEFFDADYEVWFTPVKWTDIFSRYYWFASWGLTDDAEVKAFEAGERDQEIMEMIEKNIGTKVKKIDRRKVTISFQNP